MPRSKPTFQIELAARGNAYSAAITNARADAEAIRKLYEDTKADDPDQLQDHDEQHRQQLPANQGHVLERGEKAALALECDFTHVGRGGAVLAAHRQALQQTREQQQQRCPDADAGVSRQAGDEQ